MLQRRLAGVYLRLLREVVECLQRAALRFCDNVVHRPKVLFTTIQKVIAENALHSLKQIRQLLRRHIVDEFASVYLVSPHICAAVVAQEVPVVAVHLSLSPGQALIE